MFQQWALGDETLPVNPELVPTPFVVEPTYSAPIIRTVEMPRRSTQRLPRGQRVPVKTFYYGGQKPTPKKFKAPVVNLDQTGQATPEQAAPAQQVSTAKPESTGWFASLGISPLMLLLAAGGGLLLVYFMGMTSGKKK